MPSTVTPSSSSKTSSSRASSSKMIPRTEHTDSPFIPSGHWTRKRLQEQWNKATREAGSASVTIVNEVDGEEVPGVPEDFQYLEHGYDWGRYAPDPGFLIGCDCADDCNSADTRGCCIRHIDSDLEEPIDFWYDKRVCFLRKRDFGNESHLRGQGLFRLGMDYILLKECNIVSHISRVTTLVSFSWQNCSCDETCKTRVAQNPRRIPLQVFKTPNCGWGVRPAVRVPRGTLIGLYSGRVIASFSFFALLANAQIYVGCCCA